jgi:hypothetical protein
VRVNADKTLLSKFKQLRALEGVAIRLGLLEGPFEGWTVEVHVFPKAREGNALPLSQETPVCAKIFMLKHTPPTDNK